MSMGAQPTGNGRSEHDGRAEEKKHDTNEPCRVDRRSSRRLDQVVLENDERHAARAHVRLDAERILLMDVFCSAQLRVWCRGGTAE
jgi:hypothetical protein